MHVQVQRYGRCKTVKKKVNLTIKSHLQLQVHFQRDREKNVSESICSRYMRSNHIFYSNKIREIIAIKLTYYIAVGLAHFFSALFSPIKNFTPFFLAKLQIRILF